MHHLDSSADVVEWVKGTTLTRVKRATDEAGYERFLAAYRARLLGRDRRPGAVHLPVQAHPVPGPLRPRARPRGSAGAGVVSEGDASSWLVTVSTGTWPTIRSTRIGPAATRASAAAGLPPSMPTRTPRSSAGLLVRPPPGPQVTAEQEADGAAGDGAGEGDRGSAVRCRSPSVPAGVPAARRRRAKPAVGPGM